MFSFLDTNRRELTKNRLFLWDFWHSCPWTNKMTDDLNKNSKSLILVKEDFMRCNYELNKKKTS